MELIKDDAEQEAERKTMEDEIAELEALLPEMMSKLEEVNEQGQKSLELVKEAKEMMMNVCVPVVATSPNSKVCGEVKDITNMVKSKRKIDSVDETAVKKTRLSDVEAPVTENSEPTMETETKSEETTETPAAEPITV
jgi:hypothetical protein